MGKIYTGDANGIAREVKGIYIGDSNGVARRVLKGYVGDANGIARQFYEYVPPFDPTLPDVVIAQARDSYEPIRYTQLAFTKSQWDAAVAAGYTGGVAFDWSVSIARNADCANYLEVGNPSNWLLTLLTENVASVNWHSRSGSSSLTANQLATLFAQNTNIYLSAYIGYGAGSTDWRNAMLSNLRFI